MARRLLVSDGTLAQECQPDAFKIAVGGVVKQILKASCVENGIVRQFWPPTPGDGSDPRINWTSDALIVSESVADPADSFASIDFSRSLGTYAFKAYPNADGVDSYLSPALDGTAGDDGKYLIKAVQISGDPITGIVGYNPGMMTFDGATGFYKSASQTISGNIMTIVGRFTAPSQTVAQDIIRIRDTAGAAPNRFLASVNPNNHATPDRRDCLEILIQDSSAVSICRLQSLTDVNDGLEHTFFFSYNFATAAFVYKVDGVNADDVGSAGRIAPTTGIPPTGTGFNVSIGSSNGATPGNFHNGKIGYIGYHEVTATWSDFFETDGSPKELDEVTWTEWGAQPLYWEDQGEMDAQLGSTGNMAVNGTITGPTGGTALWTDLNSASEFVYSLDQTVVGVLGAVVEITIAADDGAGLPESGTEVVKSITFSSEVRDENKVIWSPTQYDLVEIKESVDATCDLIFNPSGFAIGDADTSGSFNEAWHQDSPNVLVRDIIDRFANQIVDRFGNIVSSRAAEYTVNVTLVSGTAPTGSALGVELSLDDIHQWTLSATSGENLVNALDVTVSDGVTPITKRITMNSQRTEESATPVWTTDEWTLSDVAFPQALALIADYTITFPVAADATGRVDNASGGGVQETDAWLPGGETAADYEVMLLNTSGADGLISHTSGVWYSLASQQQFIIQYATVAGLRAREYTASIRKIGDIAVVKVVNLITAGDDGSTPP